MGEKNMKSLIIASLTLLLSSSAYAGKTRTDSQVEFSCSTYKAKFSPNTWAREAEISGTIIKNDSNYFFSGNIDYHIDCEKRQLDNGSKCWAYNQGTFKDIKSNDKYGEKDTHQYKNHIQFSNLNSGDSWKTDSYSYSDFYFPDWITNLTKDSFSKTFMAYFMMSWTNDHDGGTIPLICYTKNVK